MAGDAASINAEIGEEVKTALSAVGFTVRAASEAAGLNYRSVLRYVKGERDMPVIVLLALVQASGADLAPLAERLQAKARLQFNTGHVPESLSQAGVATAEGLTAKEAGRRITRVVAARGYDADAIVQTVFKSLQTRDVAPAITDLELLLNGNTLDPPSENVLEAIAKVIDVDPGYLTRDDAAVFVLVEARLDFERRMRELGVEQVSIYASNLIEPGDVRGIAAVVTEIITELRS